jgi:hypothetical protein
MSGCLHWLMSQSLFLALVTVYDENGELDESNSISTVGYSCIAIFCALILGSLAVLGGIANGFRKWWGVVVRRSVLLAIDRVETRWRI